MKDIPSCSEPWDFHNRYAGLFYRLIQDSFCENNAVPVLTTSPKFSTCFLSGIEDFNRAHLA